MKRVSFLLIAALSVALITSPVFSASGTKGAPIKVGIVLPLTGKQAKFGEIEKQSYFVVQHSVLRHRCVVRIPDAKAIITIGDSPVHGDFGVIA